MAHLGSCPSDVFRGRDPCLLSGVSRRIVAFDVVACTLVCALLLRLSMSRARPVCGVCARFSCPRAVWWRGVGLLKEESVSLMVYRVLDVVREFFLGEGVPDWAARGVTDRGQRANVAHLEATTVALNARR